MLQGRFHRPAAAFRKAKLHSGFPLAGEHTSDLCMWSMPRSVLKVVAVIIALCAVAGFVLGLQGTPDRGRLPGQVEPGAGGASVDAPDAKPLIEEAPPPPPPEKKKDEEEVKKDEVDPNAVPVLPVSPPAASAAKPTGKPGAPEDRVGDLLDGVTPPPQEDPPH